MKPELWMVFDCESIGLHGETFAVGHVVITADGNQVGGTRYACPPHRAQGEQEGRAWVAENCPPIEETHFRPKAVRDAFWKDWLYWKERGAVLIADCAWPVEAGFLMECIADDPDRRAWQGPYPLHELASFMVAAGMDPHATYERLPDEPMHDPLGDAKQSARLLMQALGILDRHGSMESLP